MKITGDMNCIVFVACDEQDRPESIDLGMNSVVIMAPTAADVARLYSAYCREEALKAAW